MVDGPDLAVPDQQVGVAPAAVDVRREGVEPEDRGRLVGVGNAVGVVPEGAWQEVAAEVQAEGRVEQVLDLLVRLVLRDLGVEVDGDHVRYADAEAPCELAHQDLGHQDPQSLAGAPELHDVRAEVVRLDDPGQRAALTQRR